MTSIEILASHWSNFYVIVGSSAAALMGLQFVVVALSTNARVPGSPEAFSIFNTPTIVHFGSVLLVAALVNAPWPSVTSFAAAMGVVGIVGLTYMIVTLVAMKRQTSYAMVLEDRIWHAVLPVTAYACLVGAAVAAKRHAPGGLFAVAAAALLLLFVGVHNAWDNATYVALRHLRREDGSEGRSNAS